MKAVILCSCVFMFLSLIISSTPSFTASASSYPSRAVKGAYWPSWRNSEYPPSAIDSNLYTHMYYSFLAPNPNTYKFDIDSSTASLLLSFTSALHSKKPPIKALYSIGGGGADPAFYARMASNPSSRKTFVLSSIEVARKYGFDGIDLDWEFPRDDQEMKYLGYLLDDWRAEVQREAKSTRHGSPILLTAAVYFASSFILANPTRSYPVDSINKNLDWINVMNYDYAGSWDTSATGAHAALFSPNSNVSTSYGLRSWLTAGVLKSKLVMGMPLYGKTWTLRDASVNGVGAPAVDVGPGRDGDRGILLYFEVQDYIKKNNATVVFDTKTVSAYAVDGTIWIGYDDRRTVSVKVRYAQALDIRGYFFWAAGYDLNSEISITASRSWRH